MEEHPPVYAEAMKGRLAVYANEKYHNQKPEQQSRLSTLKSILKGDVHRHNPYLSLEESVTGKHHSFREQKQEQRSTSSRTSSESSKSSHSKLMSIMSGSVHRHHPGMAIDRQLNAQLNRD